MKKLLSCAAFALAGMAMAQNPIIQTHYTADPAPMVYKDTLFLYVGCDEKDAPHNSYLMREYRLYTTTDMVNWTDRGAVLRTSDFAWSGGDASAAQCIERNGRFYWYISSQNKLSPGSAIGVAVGDSPYGPFKDALGNGLVNNNMTTYAKHGWDDLDPTVFIDDDGQAWLYWGNGVCYRARLKADMVTLDGAIEAIDRADETSFLGGFTEAPWLYKRNGRYYLVYASKFPEAIHYSMAESASGKWTAKGVVMPTERGSNTNHPGIVDFKGHSYFFYHNDALSGGHSYCRSVCVEEFEYAPDGTIPMMHMTDEGIRKGVGTLNPYRRTEAETLAWAEGMTSMNMPGRGIVMAGIHKGGYIKVRDVDFGADGPERFTAAASSRYFGGDVELRIDSLGGTLIGKLHIPYTGEWENWEECTATVSRITGVHDLYMVFDGREPHELFRLDWWRFENGQTPKVQPSRFKNPLVWADVPDPDVIRVGEWFYLVSTTMHLMPGAPVMRSRDLVNWETVSYLFDELHDTPKYDMEGGTVYGRGQWATSIRYHKGRFYALFSPNDAPYRSFVYTTEDPAKGWTLHSRMKHFHDASLFFDDDDRVYVFSGTGRVTELESDLSDVKAGGLDMTLPVRDDEETGLLEGSRMIKHDGKYYLLMISWPNKGKRREVCYRADRLTGPYEKKVILLDNFAGFPYVGQGTIVDDAKGNWYGMIFQDRGGVGRVLTLSPCTWTDGWPMLGDRNGRVPETMEVPVSGGPVIPLVVSDEFDADELDIHWQWNHNPVKEAYSLTERKGFLRLKTNKVVPSLFEARNTLTQRMEGPQCSGIVALDVRGMKDGDRAGLSAFNGNSGVLTVEKENGRLSLVMTEETVSLTDKEKLVTHVERKECGRVDLHKSRKVWLRVDADFRLKRDIARFYYSTDGKEWMKIGSDFKMKFDYKKFFMGTKFGIFNYATKKPGGYVDVDYFRYGKSGE